MSVTDEGVVVWIETGVKTHVELIAEKRAIAKGTTEKVADIKLNPQVGLSISPDRRYVLFSQIDPFVSDLMLVENFR